MSITSRLHLFVRLLLFFFRGFFPGRYGPHIGSLFTEGREWEGSVGKGEDGVVRSPRLWRQPWMEGIVIRRCRLRPVDKESLRHLPGGPVGNRRKETGRATGWGIEPHPPGYESRVLPLDQPASVFLNFQSYS